MKEIISIIIFLVSTLSYGKNALALNFARGDVFTEIKVNTENIYPKSAISISISLAHIKNANLSYKFLGLPVQGGFAIQQDPRTIFGTKIHNGVEYTVKTQEVIYYFDRSGINAIPSITLQVSGTIRGEKVSGTLKTKALELKVKRIDSPFTYSALESSGEVNVEIPKDRPLKKGDSLTYTLTLKSSGSSSLYMPPIRFNEAEDVVYYYKKLKSTDSSNRGNLESTLKYEITLVFNRAGEFTPTISPIAFYNITNGEIENIEFIFDTLQISGIYISRDMKRFISSLLVFVFTLVSLYFFKKEDIHNYISKKVRIRQLNIEFNQALRLRDYSKMISLFYIVLEEFSEGHYLLRNYFRQVSHCEIAQLENILQTHYSSSSVSIHLEKLRPLFDEFSIRTKNDAEASKLTLDINP